MENNSADMGLGLELTSFIIIQFAKLRYARIYFSTCIDMFEWIGNIKGRNLYSLVM